MHGIGETGRSGRPLYSFRRATIGSMWEASRRGFPRRQNHRSGMPLWMSAARFTSRAPASFAASVVNGEAR